MLTGCEAYIEKQKKELGYKGCRNCVRQIDVLRMCEWAERGGDGQLHFICPMWWKKEQSDQETTTIRVK